MCVCVCMCVCVRLAHFTHFIVCTLSRDTSCYTHKVCILIQYCIDLETGLTEPFVNRDSRVPKGFRSGVGRKHVN